MLPGEMFWFQIQNVCKYECNILFDFGIRPHMFSVEQTVVSSLVLSVGVNGVQCSESVNDSHHLLC